MESGTQTVFGAIEYICSLHFYSVEVNQGLFLAHCLHVTLHYFTNTNYTLETTRNKNTLF